MTAFDRDDVQDRTASESRTIETSVILKGRAPSNYAAESPPGNGMEAPFGRALTTADGAVGWRHPQPVPWDEHLTPLSFLERAASAFRDKTAVVYGEQRSTYGEFATRVNRLASALRGAGLEEGDRVAVLCPNIPPMLEAHFAVPLTGGVIVAINTRLAADDVAWILEHSGARFLLVDAEFSPLVASVRDRLADLRYIINIVDAGPAPTLPGPTYDEFLAGGQPDRQAWRLASEHDLVAINYTSGTTGRPKGVMYTHRGVYLNALGELLHSRISSDSVFLWTLPMFHANGWCLTWGLTGIGAAHVCLRKTDPGVIWPLIGREGVTHLNGAPTVLIALANHPLSQEITLERPLTVTTGGAPPSPTLIAQTQTLGAELVHVYGLTETYGPSTLCEVQPAWSALPPAEQARLKARQGAPFIIADEMRVVDDDLREVPADGQTMGEVVMRGKNIMAGYYRDPEATARAFLGGWFHSGDLAVVHPDGAIELRDRKKDIIISGGENISTIEVEQVVARHPAVLECAVVAIPDEHWGERPKAFVTLKPGMQATADEIIAFCRANLAHFKCPGAVEFGELPKTATGKIQKFVLREREWAGHDKRIH
jgi:fatty-acyl-CoA synthase